MATDILVVMNLKLPDEVCAFRVTPHLEVISIRTDTNSALAEAISSAAGPGFAVIEVRTELITPVSCEYFPP
jgi:hypothetical protein